MKITKQDGTGVYGHEIEMQGCKIFCVTDETSLKDRELCGQYVDRFRTTEVFSEMAYAERNLKNFGYVMPGH